MDQGRTKDGVCMVNQQGETSSPPDGTTEHDWQRQCSLERDMTDLGAKRYRDAVAEAQAKGRSSNMPPAIHLIRSVVEPMSKAITEFVEKSKSGKAGRRHTAAPYLEAVSPDVAAYITARVVLDHIGLDAYLQTVANTLGQRIEDEARFRAFRGEAAGLFTVAHRRVKHSGDYRYKSRVLTHAANRAGIQWEAWPQSDCVHLGLRLIDIMIETTGLVEKTTRTTRRRSKVSIAPTESATDWIDQRHARCELLSPMYLPTVIPPKPWTGAYSGGYHTPAVRPLTLVKTANKPYLAELDSHDMPDVLASINAVQATAWQINRPILEIVAEMWDSGGGVAKLPSRDLEPLPTKPHDIADNAESRSAWKRKAADTYDRRIKATSRQVQTAKVIHIAERFRDEASIYFPHQLDFRGRMYCVPLMLHPQGSDIARGLLRFAEGKPLGEHGAYWLAVHGANCYGWDKVGMDARRDWVSENEDMIWRCAVDPFDNREWAEADKPWQFLAFCHEWVGMMTHDDPETFVSHLPVQLDGSCNGLQHFSAMLRDEVGGKAVNLVPSDTPADIYQAVADVVVDSLRADISAGGMDANADENKPLPSRLAHQWLSYGIDRATCKRPVMVLPYGGTQSSCKQFLTDAINERVEEGGDVPWEPTERFYAASFLTPYVWKAIGSVVVKAREAMGWLQEVSKMVSAEGLPINWTTPAGLPVLQAYPDYQTNTVKTVLSGRTVKLTLSTPLKHLDKTKQRQGISPNFVHSMDAAALMLTVVEGQSRGIGSFSMVHDSYGTHAADTHTMADCLRRVFVRMYENHDVLSDLSDSLKGVLSDGLEFPAVPPSGGLDIRDVMHSEFFFN